MSDSIKHECGIALVRLLRPLDFYLEKYGTAFYGLNKLYLLMEKQRNRGQDGAGVACVKLNTPPGNVYMNRVRSNSQEAIQEIFNGIHERINDAVEPDGSNLQNTEWLKNNIDFAAEIYLGHLRYGTHGKNTIDYCHPFLRQTIGNQETWCLLVILI